MFEILKFFQKCPTFYFKQLLKKFLNIKLSCPIELAGIIESRNTIQQDI